MFYFLKYFIYLFICLFIYLFIYRERGREGEREGEKHQCVRAPSICCLLLTPSWGPGPQPRHVLWPGIKLVTFQLAGRNSSHWATPARARTTFLCLPRVPLKLRLPLQVLQEYFRLDTALAPRCCRYCYCPESQRRTIVDITFSFSWVLAFV